MAAFEAEIADDVDTAQEKEHEEEERRAYERVLEVVEAQRVMDQHLDEIKNKMREAKKGRGGGAGQDGGEPEGGGHERHRQRRGGGVRGLLERLAGAGVGSGGCRRWMDG
jgi:hypothetical protein